MSGLGSCPVVVRVTIASQPQYLISPYPVFTPLLPASQAQTEGVPVAGSGYMGGINAIEWQRDNDMEPGRKFLPFMQNPGLGPFALELWLWSRLLEVADPQSSGQGSVPGSVGP